MSAVKTLESLCEQCGMMRRLLDGGAWVCPHCDVPHRQYGCDRCLFMTGGLGL